MKVGSRYLIKEIDDYALKKENEIMISEVKIVEISTSGRFIKLMYEPYADINSYQYQAKWVDPVKLDIVEELNG